MTLKQAAKKLRRHLKYSQQKMCNVLDISFGALRNYESGKTEPGARACLRYVRIAEDCNRADLAEVFRSAFLVSVGLHVIHCPHCGGKIVVTPERPASTRPLLSFNKPSIQAPTRESA